MSQRRRSASAVLCLAGRRSCRKAARNERDNASCDVQIKAAGAAAGILQKTRREDGALRYDYYLSAADADAVLLVERWSSAEAQAAHLQTAHIAELKRIKEKYILDTVVEKFEM